MILKDRDISNLPRVTQLVIDVVSFELRLPHSRAWGLKHYAILSGLKGVFNIAHFVILCEMITAAQIP